MYEMLAEALGDRNAGFAYIAIIAMVVLVAFFILRAIWQSVRGGTYISGGKDRKQRLAIMDATPVDSHRRLVLVRRDDVEHLILIGGENDLLVEANIHPGKVRQNDRPVSITAADANKTPTTEQAVEKPVAEPRLSAATTAGAVIGTSAAAMAVTNDGTSSVDDVHSVKLAEADADLEPPQAVHEAKHTQEPEPAYEEPSIGKAISEASVSIEEARVEPNIGKTDHASHGFDTTDISVNMDPADLAIDPTVPQSVASDAVEPETDESTIEDEMEDLLNQLTGTNK